MKYGPGISTIFAPALTWAGSTTRTSLLTSIAVRLRSPGFSTQTMLILPCAFSGMPSENMDSGPDSLSCTQTMARA